MAALSALAAVEHAVDERGLPGGDRIAQGLGELSGVSHVVPGAPEGLDDKVVACRRVKHGWSRVGGGGVDAVSWQNAVGDKKIAKASNEENFMTHFLGMVTSARTMLTQS